MRAFLQEKAGASYYLNSRFTIAIRKQYVEFYYKLGDGWHAVATLELYKNFVRITITLRSDFVIDLFEKVLLNGIDNDKYPKLLELISDKCPYAIINDKTASTPEAHFVQEIDGSFRNVLEAVGDHAIIEATLKAIDYFVNLYDELYDSDDRAIKALTQYFYDHPVND